MPRKTTKGPFLKESAQTIYLAGLGALAVAGEEGGKLFSSLVKKGEGVEKMNKARLEKVLAKVEDVREDARAAVGRFTEPLDNGMAVALEKLGVPTRKEIVTLTRRVEELTRTVQRTKAKARRSTKRARAAKA